MSTTIISGAQTGIYLTSPTSVTITNSGTIYQGITNSGTYPLYYGVLTNTLTSATVTNSGTINVTTSNYNSGPSEFNHLYGIDLKGGGSVTNTQTGTIVGSVSESGNTVASVLFDNAGTLNGFFTQGNAPVGVLINQANATILTTSPGNGLGGAIDQYNLGSATLQNYGALGGEVFQVNATYASAVNGSQASIGGFLVGVAQIGYGTGVGMTSRGVIDNQGVIGGGFAGIGVYLANSTIVNASGGLIYGGFIGGIVSENYINLGGAPIADFRDATVRENITIENAGTISGPIGIYLTLSSAATSTIDNTGTIIGTATYAISDKYSPLRLGIGAQASFTGSIAVSPTLTNILELLSTSSAGTLSSFGSEFTGFSTIVVDSHADWTLTGSLAEFSGVPIQGVEYGTTLDISNPGITSEKFTNGTLSFYGASGLVGQLLVPEANTITNANFTLTSDGAGGVLVSNDIALCFRAGTLIRTPRGEVPVEDLKVGDTVGTLFRGDAPIVWVGRRTFNCTRHPDPRRIWPVRVATGAFGPNTPNRDLFLSPDHAVYVDGVLIPVKYLIDGEAIAQVPVDQVTYYHLELPAHDVVYAEALATESFLDTGNRAHFAEGGAVVDLYPDLALAWEANGCAPLVVSGPEVRSVRRAIAVGRRAAA